MCRNPTTNAPVLQESSSKIPEGKSRCCHQLLCGDCARRKTGHKAKTPLGEIPVATEFLDIVSLDIVGLLPVTERGNKYLLTFVDHLTRFSEAIPITKQDTETIAREFVFRIITQLGVPRKLLTDRGANFTSVLIKIDL